MESRRRLPALTNDLLEEIFLRVASPADLARASTACVSFHCLIADPSFLRRHRSIHPPLFLGFITSAGFQPAQAPQPNAAIAAAVAQAADFSFDYLPPPMEGHHWNLLHVRDGRVLAECSYVRDNSCFLDLVVCDPLSRRYLLLPSVTHNLLASDYIRNKDLFNVGASFIPSSGMVEETSFGVICWMNSRTRLAVFVFSSVSGRWSVSTATSSDNLGLHVDLFCLQDSGQCVYDCFYWQLWDRNKLIRLDMNSMQFSMDGLPPDHENRDTIIVDSGGGKIAMFSVAVAPECNSMDYYTLLQNGNEKSHDWHLTKTIRLPGDYTIQGYIGGHRPSEGYIFLEGTPKEQDAGHSPIFSIEIKLFNIERVGRTSVSRYSTHPYFGFPPSMSPRRI